MKTTRLIAGTTAAGLLGLVPLAVSAPAHAAETFQPQAALTVSLPYELQGSDRIPVGASVDVEIDVKYVGSSGAALTPYKGAASLQMYTAATGTWVDLGVPSGGTYGTIRDIKPDSNAAFRVVYSGYTATTASEDTYLPVTSAPVALPVTRKIKTNVGKGKTKKGTVIKGKVTPSYKKKPLTIYWKKKDSAEYKKLRKIKTNKKGKFVVKLPAPKKIGPEYTFQFVTKDDATYAATAYGIITRKSYFRPVG